MIIEGEKIFVIAVSNECINAFAKEVINFKKSIKPDVIGMFDNICVQVNSSTTEDEIIKQYFQKK